MRSRSLATRVLVVQVLVVAAGAAALAVTALVVAPGLFHHHLAMTGESSPAVQEHAEQAFASAFGLSLAVATGVSVVVAGAVSWFLVRRVVHPVEDLADAVDTIAGGRFEVRVPTSGFSTEVDRLAAAVDGMAGRLAATEATRTRLLADLAHELRTPVATLEAYVDGLEDGVVPVGAQSWQTMRDQLGRLRRLAADLREVATAEEQTLRADPDPVDADRLAAAAVAAAAPAFAAKGVEVRHAPSGAAPGERTTVRGDRQRLEQVLANLLDNALRHTPAGGHVVVAVTSTVTSSGGDVTVEVTDDGEGIAAEHLDAVFQRFRRLEPARHRTDTEGSGLGLTIARAVARAHGGTLTAHSPGPGRGTTMRLRLPAG